MYRAILDNYMRVVNDNIDNYTSKAKVMKLPIVPKQILSELINDVTNIFKKEPNIVKAPPNTIVVGDIHGHILDLFRILRRFHLPPLKSYVFLGDYVDRGEFSTETITLVYVLKVLFPTRVFLIRGNHEFAEMCAFSGFIYEINDVYSGPELGEAFINSFSFMPLAANIDDYAICLHGGLGENFKTLKQLENVTRPIVDYNIPVVNECLWSDPSKDTDGLELSPRGLGNLFGESVTQEFLLENKKDIIVRGHQCVELGVEKCHNDKLITVFSASRYCDTNDNFMGVILVKYRCYEAYTFPPLPYLRRVEVQFVPLITRVSSECPVFSSKKCIVVQTKTTMSTPQLPSVNLNKGSNTTIASYAISQGMEINDPRTTAPKASTPMTARAPRSYRLFELSLRKPVPPSEAPPQAPRRNVREPEACPSACHPRGRRHSYL